MKYIILLSIFFLFIFPDSSIAQYRNTIIPAPVQIAAIKAKPVILNGHTILYYAAAFKAQASSLLEG